MSDNEKSDIQALSARLETGPLTVWATLREDSYESGFGDGYYAYVEQVFLTPSAAAHAIEVANVDPMIKWHIRRYDLVGTGDNIKITPSPSEQEPTTVAVVAEKLANNPGRRGKSGPLGEKPMLTDRFANALLYSERLHRSQWRKGKDIPYIAHLLGVCSHVLEWGGDEDTAIAALLHDAVEDQGGQATLVDIRLRFGKRVAEIVLACSDSITDDKSTKAPWKERKLRHIQKLKDCVAEATLIIAADKLYNLTSTILDVRRDGAQTMARFNSQPSEAIWYHREVVSALKSRPECPPRLVAELEAASVTLAQLLGLGGIETTGVSQL